MARRMYVQQSRKGGIAAIVIITLILIILGLTNPTKADFKNYLYNQGYAEAGNAMKPFKRAAGTVKAAMVEFYTRQNYLVFSLFNRGEKTEYVGLGKFIFIKTAN